MTQDPNYYINYNKDLLPVIEIVEDIDTPTQPQEDEQQENNGG